MLTDKKVYLDGGMLIEADTLEELGAKMEVPVETLLATIDRFNSFVPDGIDRDFGRGNTAYDNYYSDPYQKPNPNVGLIAKGPFRALKLWPADLGTKGGLLTDEFARVLDTEGTVIDGLYAGGNTTASVMGRTYPGPGSTIGPAMTFGYIAGRHASARSKEAIAATGIADAEVASGTV
jgi:3-oxosteroid 1-dehydrogenase